MGSVTTGVDPTVGFFALSPDPMCLVDLSGRILRVNRAFESVLGYSPELVNQRRLQELVHEDDREVFDGELERARAEHDKASCLVRMRCEDGAHRWLTWSLNKGARDGVDAGHIFGLARDVTEEKRWEAMLRRQARSAFQIATGPGGRGDNGFGAPLSGRQAERALHQSQWLLRLLVEHTSAAVAMLDSRMRFMLVSRRFLSDYGLHGRDLIGVGYYDVFPETTRDIRVAYKRCLEGRVERRAEEPFRRRDGRVEWLRWEVHPWRHTNGEIGGLILFTEHITEQKDARERLKLAAAELAGKNEQLVEALDKAEVANKAKNTFMASMTYEVRTPLNAIIGYAEMLEEDARDSEQLEVAQDLAKILAAGKRLLELTDDVLDLAHLEAGTAQLAPETFELAEIVTEVVDNVLPLAESRGNEIVVRGLDGAGTMHADVTKVRQCMLTLVANACKFTQRGLITVLVEDEWGREREGDRVRFVVEDSGGAVDPGRVAAMFDPYTTPESPGASVPHDGTGFGVAIIRRFAELLGGEVFAERRHGEGSRFTMVLPRYAERRTFAATR